MEHSNGLQIGRRRGSLPPIRGLIGTQVALIAFVVTLCVAGRAEAGTMYVYSCHTPAGAQVGTDGWVTSRATGGPLFRNDCATGPRGSLFVEGVVGPLIANPLGSPFYALRKDVWWAFETAPATTITGFSAHLCMRGNGFAQILWPGPETLTDTTLSWAPPGTFGSARSLICNGLPPFWRDPRNQVQRQGIATQRMYVSAIGGPGQRDRLNIELASFRADIRDNTAPAVSAVRGPLASNLSHTGVESVEFDATDTGVGVYRAVVEARLLSQGEWRDVAETPLGHPGGACAEADVTAHEFEFDSPQPCPLRVTGARVDFNTDLLAVGEHEVRVVVEDASGNRTPVITPRKFIARGPAATAAPALTVAAKAAALRLTGPDPRTVAGNAASRVSGQLTDVDGKPVAGAVLTVRTRPFLPKPAVATGDWQVLGEVTTGADGTFSARLPAGGSRTVQVLRGAGDGLAAVATETNVVVPAHVTAKARRTRIRNGQSAVFTGTVRGPIPAGGVLVALEVREPGRWIPVATTRRWVRTSASGRFKLAYRFRRTFQTSTYRFRVVAAEDSAFSYSRGVSRTIDVRVKP